MFALHYSSPSAVTKQIYGINNNLLDAKAWVEKLEAEVVPVVWAIMNIDTKEYVVTSKNVPTWASTETLTAAVAAKPPLTPAPVEVFTEASSHTEVEQEGSVILPESTPEDQANVPL